MDAEIQTAREGERDEDSEEDETEVLKCPHAENQKASKCVFVSVLSAKITMSF